jgi:hypothetical protein
MRAAAVAFVLLAAACGPGGAPREEPPFDPAKPGPVELPGEPMHEPFPWRPVAAAGVATIAAAVVVARRRRHAAPEPVAVAAPAPSAPAEGPHVRALRRLGELRARPPHAADDHAETASILREYAAERFGVAAAFRTTDELVRADAIPAASRPRLAAALSRCDLVKFAKDEPPAAARASLLDEAAAFVMETAAA